MKRLYWTWADTAQRVSYFYQVIDGRVHSLYEKMGEGEVDFPPEALIGHTIKEYQDTAAISSWNGQVGPTAWLYPSTGCCPKCGSMEWRCFFESTRYDDDDRAVGVVAGLVCKMCGHDWIEVE